MSSLVIYVANVFYLEHFLLKDNLHTMHITQSVYQNTEYFDCLESPLVLLSPYPPSHKRSHSSDFYNHMLVLPVIEFCISDLLWYMLFVFNFFHLAYFWDSYILLPVSVLAFSLPSSIPWYMLLLLLSRFSRVRLCAIPETAAHQAPPSLGLCCHFLLQCMKVKSESEAAQSVQLFATPWTAAYQAPLSMGFSRQEYWSEVPLPSPMVYATSLIFILLLMDLRLFPIYDYYE